MAVAIKMLYDRHLSVSTDSFDQPLATARHDDIYTLRHSNQLAHRASANGTVIFSGRNGSFGKTIKIKHKHGIETLYGHLHKILVKKGTEVKEGEIIGKMGATGRAVGAHLHYEIIVNKKHINPYNFISIGRNLLSSSILKN